MTTMARWMKLALVGLCGLLAVGCLQRIALDAQIGAIRRAHTSMNTLHDFDVARAGAYAGLTQLEGLYELAPHNDDILRLLNAGWGSTTFAFTLTDLEMAMIADDEEEFEFQRRRGRAGFARAKFYGEELLKRRADGFEEAKLNAESIRAWLVENFDEPEDAEDLLWLSFAWMTHVASSMDIPEIVAEMYIGVALAERVIELNEREGYGTAHIILGIYYSHSGEQDVKRAKQHFDRGIALEDGKYLPPMLGLATGYHCAAGNKVGYFDTLREVIRIGEQDPMPEARLSNLLAMRRASLYLRQKVFQESCAFNKPPERKVTSMRNALPEFAVAQLPRLAQSDAGAGR